MSKQIIKNWIRSRINEYLELSPEMSFGYIARQYCAYALHLEESDWPNIWQSRGIEGTTYYFLLEDGEVTSVMSWVVEWNDMFFQAIYGKVPENGLAFWDENKSQGEDPDDLYREMSYDDDFVDHMFLKLITGEYSGDLMDEWLNYCANKLKEKFCI